MTSAKQARPTTSGMTPRAACAALLAVCAIVAAGCGGGGGTSASVGAPISFEALSQSASTSAEARSGRFAFDMSLTMPGVDEPFAFTGEGAFDRASDRASFSVDMSSFAKLLGGFLGGFGAMGGAGPQQLPDFEDPAGWKIEVIQDGDVGYVRFPALDERLPEGKSWIRAEEGDTGTGFELEELEGFAQTDPREVLEALRGVTSDIETVGTEELRGETVTHYRALIDPAELAEKAPQGTQEKAQSLVDELTSQSGMEKVPLDVWLDETGLVRKLSLDISATDPGTSLESDASLAFELWDYDQPVAIELPLASEVVDASDVRR